MTDRKEIERVAAGLTGAQRRAVMDNRAPEGGGKWPLRNALLAKGIFTDFPWKLTSLGSLVRGHLLDDDRRARECRPYGSLDDGVPNRFDHMKRGFQP